MDVAFTPESARAAIALGPVEYRCSVCGHMHSTDRSNEAWPCLLRYCRDLWLDAYNTFALGSVRTAAVRLQHVVQAMLKRGAFIPETVLTDLVNCDSLLDDCIFKLTSLPRDDFRYLGTDLQVVYRLTDGRGVGWVWILMISRDCAAEQIRKAARSIVSDAFESCRVAIPVARNIAEFLSIGPAAFELLEASQALEAEIQSREWMWALQ